MLRLIQEGEGRGVSHEILKYLRHTPIGLQALLNLRLTSRRVKNWVDRSLDYTSYGAALLPFPLHDGEDTAILVLQRFLRAPPPPWIISIIFDGQFPPDLTNSEDRTIWTQFLQIWKPKIRSLSVKKLELPLSRLEIDFLSAANLQVFKIQSVLVDLEKSHGIPHSFPPLCLMKISEFRLAESDHRFPVEDYLKILLKSSRVRIVQISASNRSELRLITRIIQRHNNDPGFLLQLKVNIIENPVRTKAAQECCASIINSECVVEIYDAMPPCLQWLISGLSPQNKSAILGRVKSIMGWQYTEAIPLSTMTNAEFLGNFNMDLAQWKESLPEKLKFLRLRITQELSFTLNLCPGSLEVVILEFTEEVTTSPYIRRIVTSLQVNCKRLRHLSLYLGRFVVEPELSLIRLDPIEGLTSVRILMRNTPPAARRMVLLQLLRLDEASKIGWLELSSLSPTDINNGRQLEEETMRRIFEGGSEERITRFKVRYGQMTPGFRRTAEHLYERFFFKAEANAAQSSPQIHDGAHFQNFRIRDVYPENEDLPEPPMLYG